MRRVLVSCIAVCLATALAGPVSSVAAQTPWVVPRTPDGRPDLQGNWTNETLTPFERPRGQGRVLTPEQVSRIERGQTGGTDAVCFYGAGTCNDRITLIEAFDYRVATVNGEPRSSLITSPPDGRVPMLTAEGRRRSEDYQAFRRQFGRYDHPELRPLSQRCLMSFGSIAASGSGAGPPILPNDRLYNNNYTIVQTVDHIMIMAEMVHDARIIRIGDGPRLPAHVRPWMGDSWGHWEGDVLVVETTNFHPLQRFRGNASDNLKVTERFSRIDEETILYEFTVDDPTTYAAPWGGEVPMKALHDQLYEYACHEGNHNLVGILRGARYQERL
jgi:hypothetical protein